MDLNLSGRHALVCGASEGIGRATAEELAELGATVTVLSRREGVLREVVSGLATPARIALIVTLLALVATALSLLWALA